MAEREGFEPSVRVYPVHSLSRRAPSADSATSPYLLFFLFYRPESGFQAEAFGYEDLAEEVGFEPTVLSHNGFQDRRLKPLGHSSVDSVLILSGNSFHAAHVGA